MSGFSANPAKKERTLVLDSNDNIYEELDMSITSAFNWAGYLSADLFEPYNPSNPFVLRDSVFEDK